MVHATPLRITMVAGELSGDQLGASLIKTIRARHPDAIFNGVAGPAMRTAGCEVILPSEKLAVMGLLEVLLHLPRILMIRYSLLKLLKVNPPDLFIGIDAPDFNLGIERQLKKLNIPVAHWVSPSVWAWRSWRVHKIRRSVDLLLTLFPFEQEYLLKHHVPAKFVGHPFADEINWSSIERKDKLACVALLPGSRRSEIKKLLPVFLEAAVACMSVNPDLRFVVPVASSSLIPLCQNIASRKEFKNLSLELRDGNAREAIQSSAVALVASGTATLECMLLNRPMVVAYKTHPLTAMIVKRMLNVPWVSLPNQLLGKMQIPEYIQEDATAENLSSEVLGLLNEPGAAQKQTEPFENVHKQLRKGAADRAAEAVIELCNEHQCSAVAT